MEYMEEGGGFFSISFFFPFLQAPSTEMCLFISPCTEHRYIILRSWDISKLALEDRLVLQLDFHLFLTISLLCYDAILYHSILKLVFSCTSSSYPLDTYERDLVVYNYVCTKSQFTVCWKVKIHCALCVHKLNVCWEVRIYCTAVCTQTHFRKTWSNTHRAYYGSVPIMNIVQRVQTRGSKTGWVEFGLEWKVLQK